MKKTTLNIVGREFGNLTVLSFSHYYRKYTFWNCKCSCGNEIVVNQKALFSGEIISCGCITTLETLDLTKQISKPPINNKSGVKGVCFSKNDKLWNVVITYNKITYAISSYKNFGQAANARLKAEEIIDYIRKEYLKNNPTPPRPPKKPTQDLVGKKFGKLTVVSLVKIDRYTVWHCRCECGKETDVLQHNLCNGKTTSCGCEKKKKAKELSEQYLHTYKGIQIEKSMAKTTPRNNTSGFRGVMLDKKTGKYRVRMILQGVRYELGWYSDFEEAKKARLVGEEKREAIVEEYFSSIREQT